MLYKRYEVFHYLRLLRRAPTWRRTRFRRPAPQSDRRPLARGRSAPRRHCAQTDGSGPLSLDETRRASVLEALRNVCSHLGWDLLAAHVRTNHVHAIVEADARPERVMNAFKSYASRCLNRLGFDGPERKRWARHGSTRWLWKDEDVRNAIRYVVEEQGEPMAVFLADAPAP